MITKMEITGDKAFQYLKDQVSLGGKTLSNYLNLITLRKGKIYSYVPQETTPKTLYDLNSGGIYAYEKPSNDNPSLVPVLNKAKCIIVDLIYEYLKENDSCCIFEEANGSPNDQWVKTSPIEYVRVGNEMYYYFDRENNSKEKIEKALVSSDGYYFLCVLSKLGAEKRASFVPFKEVKPFILEELIKNIKVFIVKAYDGEGYLMWEV